ncbi:serine/threonine protein kinase [bacterium]|nr:serine/threonine protein kinase [bacterium]
MVPMRPARDQDLVAGVLALAYGYAGLGGLRDGFAELEGNGSDPDCDLVEALRRKAELSPFRAQKLRRASRLALVLKDDAIYGMIALRNRLLGTSMLNACMEESRRTGFQRTLPELLLEKGFVTEAIDKAIRERRDAALESLSRTEDDLLRAVDFANDDPATTERKLAVLMGEIASKLSFLSKDELETCLKIEERVQNGLPAEEVAAEAEEAVQATAEGTTELDATPLEAETKAQIAASAGATEDEPIKGYELMERLGTGAMGAVLKARKKDTGEVVALKILKPDLAKDMEFVQRFNREALAVQALNHPNIIRAVQVGRSGEYHFFAMEYVDGETASKIIKVRGKIGERLALSVVRQVASALEHAWKHKIIHRDIKPDNIMITRTGEAKLTDLGLARTVHQQSTLTITGVVMGSPAYISPEQATGEKNLDTRSDIYALGASLYHMLAGVVPYDGDSPLQVMLRHMNDPLPDVRQKEPGISEATRRIIFKMMAKRPESRFQSPRDVHDAIVQVERALQGGPAPSLASSDSAQAKRPAAAAPPAKKTAPSRPSSDESRDLKKSSSDVRSKAPEPKKPAPDVKKALGLRLRKKRR